MPPLIGIFGGTFDPPHIGHLILASEAQFQLGLDRLLWVLTPTPPHKQARPITPVEHRLAMVQLAIIDEPIFELSSVEIDRPGPHYTVDTVEILADQYSDAELIYLLGADALKSFPTWIRSADIVSLCRFLGVLRRPGESIDLGTIEKTFPGIKAKIRFIEAPLMEIASHEIRTRAAEGRPFRYFVPPCVYEYIVDHRLYRI